MNDTMIRLMKLAVLNGESGDIRRLLLTNEQVDLVQIVNARVEVTASEMVKMIDNVSIQNMSAKLSTLYDKGYLKRTTHNAESGGIEHRYKVNL